MHRVLHAAGISQPQTNSRRWIILGGLLLVALLLPLAAAFGASITQRSTLADAQQEMVSLIEQVNPSVVQVQSRAGGRGSVGSGEIFTSSGCSQMRLRYATGWLHVAVRQYW